MLPGLLHWLRFSPVQRFHDRLVEAHVRYLEQIPLRTPISARASAASALRTLRSAQTLEQLNTVSHEEALELSDHLAEEGRGVPLLEALARFGPS